MSIYGLPLCGWEDCSTWGADADLATGSEHFYAQLTRNGHSDDDGPQFWISPPRHPPYRTVAELAEAISHITTVDATTVLQAMSAGVDPSTRRALLLPEQAPGSRPLSAAPDPQPHQWRDLPAPAGKPVPEAGTPERANEGPGRADGPEWVDLAANPPGIGVSYEATRRRRVEGAGADRSWRVGADGEFEVASLLASLTTASRWDRLRGRRPRWFVLHSVPLGDGHGRIRGDVDHLLIGPPGLVSINTKHHRTGKLLLDGDELFLNGHPTDYVAKARREAERIEQFIRPALTASGATELASRLPVRPLIVIVGGRLLVDRWPSGVTVVMIRTLIEVLSTLPAVLAAPEVTAVYELARRSTTWNPSRNK